MKRKNIKMKKIMLTNDLICNILIKLVDYFVDIVRTIKKYFENNLIL